jgi:hypothetical protein
MHPVILTEPFQMSEWWSWVFVAWILPAAPLAFALWWLFGALRFELQRRTVVNPPPGYRLITGTIGRDRKRKAAAIAVTFQLQLKFIKGHKAFAPHTYTISVNPFTIETEDGKRLEVRPTREAVALHAAVEGAQSLRSSHVTAGDRVWVYGRAGVVGPDALASETQRHGRQPSGNSRLWVSTLPIAEVFHASRNRCLRLAAAVLGFLLVLELAIFGGYWDILRAGKPAVGYVVDQATEAYKRRERTGRSYWDVACLVTVEANGRHEELEVADKSWVIAELQTPVVVLLSPATMMLGPEPHTTMGRCAWMLGLTFFGLLGFILAGNIGQRPWYSTKRGWHGKDRTPPAR